jgi:hypothetical protein
VTGAAREDLPMTHRVKALLASCALVVAIVAVGPGAGASSTPPTPELPDDFTWTGRYLVPDLDLDVPFTWHGNGGDTQMIAGSDDDPIHFTNVISDGVLYTLTYKWPDIERRPCSPIGPFTVADLNQGLERARFVGKETLEGKTPRKVNHWRAGVVFEPPPEVLPPIPGVGPLRIPVASGDIYVARNDPTKFWQVLQFGIQNLYDPELDEWIRITKMSTKPGKVELPEECATAPVPTTAAP